MGEVVQKSSPERIYNVMVLFFGLILGGSLIAMLSSMMTQARMKVEDSSKQFLLLQQYLTQHTVPSDLSTEIKLQVISRTKEKARLKMQDVRYLSLLSSHTLDRLKKEHVAHHLASHAFLNVWLQIDTLAKNMFCNIAVDYKDLTKG